MCSPRALPSLSFPLRPPALLVRTLCVCPPCCYCCACAPSSPTHPIFRNCVCGNTCIGITIHKTTGRVERQQQWIRRAVPGETRHPAHRDCEQQNQFSVGGTFIVRWRGPVCVPGRSRVCRGARPSSRRYRDTERHDPSTMREGGQGVSCEAGRDQNLALKTKNRYDTTHYNCCRGYLANGIKDRTLLDCYLCSLEISMHWYLHTRKFIYNWCRWRLV